jgi:transcriptional regulator with XRE-family HTH domain
MPTLKRMKTPTPANFANVLKATRKKLGLNQAEVATFLDVSPRAIWKWENGIAPPLALTAEGALARLALLKKAHAANRKLLAKPPL